MHITDLLAHKPNSTFLLYSPHIWLAREHWMEYSEIEGLSTACVVKTNAVKMYNSYSMRQSNRDAFVLQAVIQ